jgi:sporulation protein YlmC with PRC-barrel domain
MAECAFTEVWEARKTATTKLKYHPMKISKSLMVLLLSGAVGSSSLVAATPQQQQQQRDQQLQQRQQQIQQQQQQQQQRPQVQQDPRQFQHQQTGAQPVGLQRVQVVKEDKLDKKLTSQDLMGKEVYTRDGEKIGSIENLHLDGFQFAQIEREFVRDEDREDREDRALTRQDRTEVRAPANVARDMSQFQNQTQVAVLVKMDEGDFLAVPADQLRYNAEEERFTASLSKEQLKQIRERADRDSERDE